MTKNTFVLIGFMLLAAGCAHSPAVENPSAARASSDALEEDEILRALEPDTSPGDSASTASLPSDVVPPLAGASGAVVDTLDRREEREDSLLSTLESRDQKRKKSDAAASGRESAVTATPRDMTTIREDPLLSAVDPEHDEPEGDLEEEAEGPVGEEGGEQGKEGTEGSEGKKKEEEGENGPW